MKHSFPSLLLLLGSLVLPCVAQDTSQPPGLEGITDPEMTKRLIHYWADYGCFSFSDNSEPNVSGQCKEACYPGGITSDVQGIQSQTCWLNGPESDASTGNPLTDEEKSHVPRLSKTIKTGYCICNDPIINYLGDFFIHSMVEMGKILEKVMCPALMALDLVVEIGSMAIPGVGKAITVGMRTGVKTAKMFKHAYDAQDAAMEWASMFVDQGFGLASAAGCKTPFTFSKAALAAKFVDFSDAPDELVPGLNLDEMPCPKGKKASKECKKKNGESEDEDPAKTGDNNQPTPTNDPQSSAVSSTSTSDSSVPTADCAAIGRKDQESLLEENPSLGEEPDLPAKRAVGSTLQSRRLEARKRGFSEKSSQPCFTGKNVNKLIGGMTIKSKKYPTAGDDSMAEAKAYGFSILDSCSDYTWSDTTPTSECDTEHVLEWSMVGNFFNVVNKHADFVGLFDNPDPEPADSDEKKLDFCKYWIASWGWPTKQKMSNPDPALSADQDMQTPLQWFAEAYPFVDGQKPDAKRRYEDEFVLLQKKINQNVKNAMFSDSAIYDDETMKETIERRSKKLNKAKQPYFGEPHEQPRAALQRLRAVVGAFIYLKEKKVDDIFVAQVDRIGAQLEHLETALSTQPREMDKGKGADKHTVKFALWQPQKLKEKWFAYMDDVYTKADKKAQDFMTDNIKRLNDEYDKKKMIDQKDIDKEKNDEKRNEMKLEKDLRKAMEDNIPKLEAEWKKVKDWTKPKWNGGTPAIPAVLPAPSPTPSPAPEAIPA